MRASPRPAHPHPHRPVLRVDAPAGAFFFLKKHLLIFLGVYKSCAAGGRSRRGFFLLKKHLLIFLSVYKSCAAGGRSRRGFFFLKKHLLIFLSVYKSCVAGGRSRRGFLFSSKTPSYTFECIQVLCYGSTLPQFFVFFKHIVLYF